MHGIHGPMAPWESIVVEAVGTVIDFWGFKRNQGRLWALLYIRGEAMDAAALQQILGLSKGAVSMIVRDLEARRVIRRVRQPPVATWHFESNHNFMSMIDRVLREREAPLIHGVRQDLAEAERMASADPNVNPQVLDRLRRMRALASIFDRALHAFLKTSQLDLRKVPGVLMGTAERRSA